MDNLSQLENSDYDMKSKSQINPKSEYKNDSFNAEDYINEKEDNFENQTKSGFFKTQTQTQPKFVHKTSDFEKTTDDTSNLNDKSEKLKKPNNKSKNKTNSKNIYILITTNFN